MRPDDKKGNIVDFFNVLPFIIFCFNPVSLLFLVYLLSAEKQIHQESSDDRRKLLEDRIEDIMLGKSIIDAITLSVGIATGIFFLLNSKAKLSHLNLSLISFAGVMPALLLAAFLPMVFSCIKNGNNKSRLIAKFELEAKPNLQLEVSGEVQACKAILADIDKFTPHLFSFIQDQLLRSGEDDAYELIKKAVTHFTTMFMQKSNLQSTNTEQLINCITCCTFNYYSLFITKDKKLNTEALFQQNKAAYLAHSDIQELQFFTWHDEEKRIGEGIFFSPCDYDSGYDSASASDICKNDVRGISTKGNDINFQYHTLYRIRSKSDILNTEVIYKHTEDVKHDEDITMDDEYPNQAGLQLFIQSSLKIY